MKDESGEIGMEPDADEHRALPALFAQSRGRRISSATLAGDRVWIKRYDAERRPFPKRLHSLISPLLLLPFLRSAKETDAAGMADREMRKMAAFRAAGFEVPRIVGRDGSAIILSDVAPIMQDRLDGSRKSDPAAHDALLVQCAVALGKAHAAGLCHGRPHPRDFFEKDGVPHILARQPLVTTEPSATLAAPERVGHSQALPVRGIGPNGEHDRVMLVKPDAPLDAEGPRFFPAENVEATLDAPEQPGVYELRYLMNAPVSGLTILARRPIRVE